MSKDPAFLFYSKDWYEGTRMMLPEERACYMDLLIYQHQNGIIPNNLKRVMMYCSGIDEATLKATLEAKFKHTDKGWVNEKLKIVVSDRENYTNRQSLNGQIGQFWKKSKAILNATEYKLLRKTLVNIDNNEILEFLKDKNINEATLKDLLKAPLKHLAIANAIEDVNEIEVKDETIEESEKLNFHFDSKNFIAQWDLYKVFRRKKHRFSFLNTESENRALKELYEISGQNEKIAIKIIEQTIDKGWKGLFELKINKTSVLKNQSVTVNEEKYG